MVGGFPYIHKSSLNTHHDNNNDDKIDIKKMNQKFPNKQNERPVGHESHLSTTQKELVLEVLHYKCIIRCLQVKGCLR